LKNVQERDFSQNLFFSKEMAGLRFVFYNNDFKMVLKGVYEL